MKKVNSKNSFSQHPVDFLLNNGQHILLKAFYSVSYRAKIKRIVLKSFIRNESRNFSVKNFLKVNLSIIYSNRSLYSTLHSWYCVSEEQWSSYNNNLILNKWSGYMKSFLSGCMYILKVLGRVNGIYSKFRLRARI